MADEIRIYVQDKYELSAVIRKHNGNVWNRAILQFEPFNSNNYKVGNYNFLMRNKGGSLHVADFPNEIPLGQYDVEIFDFSKHGPFCVGSMGYRNKTLSAIWGRIKVFLNSVIRNKNEYFVSSTSVVE